MTSIKPYISSSTTSNTSSSSLLNLPTVPFKSITGMDIFSGIAPDNYDEVRGKSLSTNVNVSRDSSVSSTRSSVVYHEKMEQNNAMIIDDDPNDSSPALSYEDKQERAIQVSKAADPQNNMRPHCDSLIVPNPNPQRVLNEDPLSNSGNNATQVNTSHEDEVINIQLPYDPQAPTEPELWSSSFHPISLHGSIEHFTSDAKNIKVSLNFLAKYIQGKQVNGNKVNDLNDFDGMGDAIWNFISSVYASK